MTMTWKFRYCCVQPRYAHNKGKGMCHSICIIFINKLLFLCKTWFYHTYGT